MLETVLIFAEIFIRKSPCKNIYSILDCCLSYFCFRQIFFAQSIDQKLAEIDVYANQVMKDRNQPGMAIAVVKDGKTVFAKGYGVQKLGANDAFNENTLFVIASNSKAFTTASLSILIDEGKIRG